MMGAAPRAALSVRQPEEHAAPRGTGRMLRALAGLLLGALAAELGVRAWLLSGGGPVGGPAAALRAAAAEIDGSALAAATAPLDSDEAPWEGDGPGGKPEPEQRVSHPYFGWAGSRIEERITRYAESFREDDAGRLDVLILGGSVAALFVRAASEDLIELLQADERYREREVRILNLASGSLKQPQHEIRLAVALDRGWRPELVLLIDGFNELVYPVQNAQFGVEPTFPAFTMWGPVIGGDVLDAETVGAIYAREHAGRGAARLHARFERYGLAFSALLSELAWERMRRLRSEHVAATERLVAARAARAGLPGARGLEPGDAELLAVGVEAWREGSRSIAALCAARGVAFVHVLQPVRDDVGAKPLTAEERADVAPDNWIEAVRAGYPLLRAAGAELASAGVRFVDASRLFEHEPETMFTDRCHLNLRGNQRLAERFVPALLEALP